MNATHPLPPGWVLGAELDADDTTEHGSVASDHELGATAPARHDLDARAEGVGRGATALGRRPRGRWRVYAALRVPAHLGCPRGVVSR